MQWNGPTLDRTTGLLLTPVVEWCMTIFSEPTAYAPPTVSYGGTVKPDPVAKGAIVALDSTTGATRWRYEAESPMVAGVTPTAGGVTFAGDMAGNFLVLESKTGALLRKIPTAGALAGGIVTYELGGTQYVAVASGNVSRQTFGVLGIPSVVIMSLAGREPARSSASAGGSAGAGNVPAATLYAQICASCHGPRGDEIADHKLTTLSQRRSLAETVSYLKNPKAPMPRLYPEVLSEQSVLELARYLHSRH